MREAWTDVKHRVGRRGAWLLFLTELDLFYACLLAWPTPATSGTATPRWFATMLPLDAWAAMWAAVGLICLVYAFTRYDRPAYMAAILIKVIWTGLAVLGVWFADVPASTPAIFLSLAGAVWLISGWREPGLDAEDADHG